MTSPTPSLVGPPELHNKLFTLSSSASHPLMGFTENNSSTFLSSGNPCLDFFFHIVPDTRSDSLKERLQKSWNFNSLTTLKLICNLRGVRGTGKSDKEGFYTAALWLHKYHPKTLACNVSSFANFGYFKDLPEILFRLLEGSDVRKNQKAEWLRRKGRGGIRRSRSRSRSRYIVPLWRGRFKLQDHLERRRKRIKLEKEREHQISKALERSKIEKEKASIERKRKKVSMANKALERYRRDPDYRFLYDRVSDFFADCLKADIQYLNSEDLRKISLAAKWCPSIDSSFDRSTLICESIARKVFPRESYPEYKGIEEAHYAYRVRDRLRKEILVPLRKALELPEVYIGANQWKLIPYNRVASVAMKSYKEKFMKHNKKRFTKYLEDVKDGKQKIAAGALLPHEIIASLDSVGEVAELQWKRTVDDLLKKGKLRNCIAVCDVSGSMQGIPMEVCVALGILVSELSEDPWKGKVITFSQRPQLHLIKGDDLQSKYDSVSGMEWGYNTDFQKVFDMILKVAVDGKLKEEEMIKRVFVFSDMEFDQASNNSWETDYKVIVRKFKKYGYGSVVPQIVFWNLRDSRAMPVSATEKGVAMVSGFSKNMIKLFFENDGILQPELIMEMAVSGEEYKKLVVVD